MAAVDSIACYYGYYGKTYCCWRAPVHSIIFNDFTSFFVDPSAKVFALIAVIIGHRSHCTLPPTYCHAAT